MEKNENGYSGYNFGNRGRVSRGRDGSCPGTGEIWQGNGMNGNMSESDSEGGNMEGLAGMKCSERQLGMVYSPFQCWRKLYSTDEALTKGTLFEELYKPLEEGR